MSLEIPDLFGQRRPGLSRGFALFPGWFVLVLSLCAGVPVGAGAQTAAPADTIPSIWETRARPERPDLSRLTTIRFLTETDFPPFNYAGQDDSPVGLNVDLARMVCEELGLKCTIQMRRFDTLIGSLVEARGDAVIASIRPTPALRERVDFSDPYYRTPARFVAARPVRAGPLDPAGRRVAVVEASAHEAFLTTFFPQAIRQPFPDLAAARAALKERKVDLVFADGIQLAIWLNGTDSAGCCAFAGGPYLESRFFGEGIAIQVRRGDDNLRKAINWGLFQVWEKGRFAPLWLKYFPVNPFAGPVAPKG
jgi:polar amino acid transport system substrate-binding protein